MIDRLMRLLNHPGFRAAPLTVLGRGVALAWVLQRGRNPRFRLSAGGPIVEVPADRRYTTVSAYLMRQHVEPELAALDRFLGVGDVMIDVGANIGLFSLRGAHLVGPSGLVLAVEPGAVSLARLGVNMALNRLSQLRLVPAALSDRQGEMALYHIPLGDDPQAFSLLAGEAMVASEMVRVTTLDLLSAAEGLTRLDCIKIDVEGAEPLVLAGGLETLRRFHPIIIFEVNAPMTQSSHAAADTLLGLGYRLHRLHGGRLQPVATIPAEHGNLVAVHPDGRQPR